MTHRSTRRAFRIIATVACLPAALAAQQNRDAGKAPPTGTASISGIVVSTDASRLPIHRAIVTLAGGGLGFDRSAVTDDAGAFTFARLPAGSFTVTAWKASYLTSAYGARRPAHPGTPIAITEGQHVDQIVVPLAKGGVIAGSLHGADGTPLEGVQVIARRNGDPPPRLNFASPGAVEGAITDDRGAYRIFGLVPGTYTVIAVMNASLANEMHRRSAADVDAAFREAQIKGTAPQGPPPAPLPAFTVAPIYFPGTPIAAEASTIEIGTGTIRDDVSFTIEPVRSAEVSGTVTGPGDGRVNLVISGSGSSMPLVMSMAPHLFRSVQPDGSFRYVNVAPGHYTVSAIADTTVQPNIRSSAGGTALSSGAQVASAPLMWAAAEIDVTGEDVTGLSLMLQPGLNVGGRVAIDASSSPAPQDLSTLRVLITPLNSLGSGSSNGTEYGGLQRSVSVPVAADGTFAAAGRLTPGTYKVAVSSSATGGLGHFRLRSAMLDDRDLVDSQLTVAPGSNIDRILVTLTDRHSELSGSLATPEGRPATDYFVVVLPTDRTLWLADARRIKSTRPATSGEYSFADLPAGSYLLAAIDDLEPTDLADAAFLEAIAKAGVAVTIADGEKKTQDLRLK